MLKKLGRLLQNPQRLAKLPELKYWLFITVLITVIYSILSSGDFSFLMTTSALLEALSLLGIVLQLQQSYNTLSFNTFLIYSIIYFTRLCSILPYESYLPYDSTGDWLYQVIQIVSLLISLFIANKLKNIKEDKIYLCLIPIILIFSFIVHPNLNRNFLTDACWMNSMMLESIAIVPLIWRVKESNDLESFSSHFIAAHSVSIILNFLFWSQTYGELNKANSRLGYFSTISGYFVIGSQLSMLGFTGQFLWYYLKSAISGMPLVLPL